MALAQLMLVSSSSLQGLAAVLNSPRHMRPASGHAMLPISLCEFHASPLRRQSWLRGPASDSADWRRLSSPAPSETHTRCAEEALQTSDLSTDGLALRAADARQAADLLQTLLGSAQPLQWPLLPASDEGEAFSAPAPEDWHCYPALLSG